MHGIYYFFSGLQLILKPSFRRYLLWPICINLLLMVLLGAAGYYGLRHLSDHLFHFLPFWLHFLESIVIGIGCLVGLSLMAFLFTLFAGFLGAPFYSLLCEAIMAHKSQQHCIPNDHFLETLKDMPRLLQREWVKTRYYLLRALIFFILFFVPVINLAAPLLWFLFNGWMQAIQYCDFPADIAKHPFENTPRQLRQCSFTSMSFGLLVFLLMMIPVINILVVPAAVAGGTLLWAEKMNPARFHPTNDETLGAPSPHAS